MRPDSCRCEESEDEVALVLLEKQEKLQSRNAELKIELEKIGAQAEELKEKAWWHSGGYPQAKARKNRNAGQEAKCRGPHQDQETLDGLSTDADVQALDNIRSGINQYLNAEADIGTELGDASLDAKLAKIKAKTGSANARKKLDELKKQQAAREAASNVQ